METIKMRIEMVIEIPLSPLDEKTGCPWDDCMPDIDVVVENAIEMRGGKVLTYHDTLLD